MFISPITRWFDLRAEARIATVLGGGVVVLAVTTLLGWWASIPALFELSSTTTPLLGNTALCMGLAGAAVLAIAFGWGRLARLLAAVVMVVGAITFGEYLFKTDLGLDEILFPSFSRIGAGSAGRMSPIAAHCLAQVGLALFLLSFDPSRFARSMVAALLGSITVGVCGMALLGYIFDLPDTSAWTQSTGVSPQGALSLVLLGCSVVGLAWRNPVESEGYSPRWLAGAVAFAGLSATLILWQALHSSQREQIRQAVAENAREAGDQVKIRMEARISAFARMARRWDFQGRPSEAVWEDDAKAYVHDFPDIKALQWIDAQQRVQWVEPQAGAGLDLAGNALREDRQLDAAEVARRTHTPVMTGCAPLPGGVNGFVVYTPIHVGDRFDGWIAAVFDSRHVLDRYLAAVAPGDTLAVSENGLVFYARDLAPRPISAWVVKVPIDLPGVSWRLSAWPTPRFLRQAASPLPQLTLACGLLSSAMLALIVYLSQRARASARSLAEINRSLLAAQAEIKVLSGLLPICAECKRIRDDDGFWNRLERFISTRSTATFSHGVCPECAVRWLERDGVTVPENIRVEYDKRQFDP